jgi:hypothetical protein
MVIPEIEKEISGMQILDHIHAQYSHKIQDVDFKVINQHHRFLRYISIQDHQSLSNMELSEKTPEKPKN